MIVFNKNCIRMRCEYVPFRGVGEVSESDNQCVGPYIIKVVNLGLGENGITCGYGRVYGED